jgi:8-oxo-dGTP diphosphatase
MRKLIQVFLGINMPNNPQIILPGRYSMVTRTLTLLFKGDQVLLQKAPPTKKIWANHYNGLGGHVENSEDIYSSANRELLEESGLECLDLTLRGVITIEVQPEQGILLFVFSGQNIRGQLQPSDEGTLEWIGVDKISTLPVVEDIPNLVKMLVEKRSLFFGHYAYSETGKLIATFNYPQ